MAEIRRLTKTRKEVQRGGVGRPPLKMEPMILRLPKEVKDRIDAMVGKKRRAQFIREAIERELSGAEGSPAFSLRKKKPDKKDG
jgi:hypothetical protein